MPQQIVQGVRLRALGAAQFANAEVPHLKGQRARRRQDQVQNLPPQDVPQLRLAGAGHDHPLRGRIEGKFPSDPSVVPEMLYTGPYRG